MIKKYLRLPLLILTILIGLGLAGQAISPVNPANSAVNPVHGTLYYVENDADPRVHVRSGADWSTLASENLPAASTSHGLAVSADGSKLFVSVGQGAASEVRSYPLDGSGIPDGTPPTDMSGDIWGPGSLPAGMAFGDNNRLFVVDNGAGRLWVYNTDTNAMVKLVTSGISGQTGLFGVAVSPADGLGAYKIFISQKVNSGKIYVYDYNPAGDTVTYLTNISAGLSYPTYLKVSADKLYVAVNGSDGIDVKVYDISGGMPYLALAGSVENPDVNASYGWTAFDLTPGGSRLVYKRALNSSETSNKIYSILTADISGTVAAEETDSGDSEFKADGLAISADGTRAALTYSPNGDYNDTADITPAVNGTPTIVMDSLKQYRLDGVTELMDEDMTDENQIIVQFVVNDSTPTGTLIPTVAHRLVGGVWTEEIMASQSPGATVNLTIPVSGTFSDGNYEWRVKLSDGDIETAWYEFGGGDANDTDFIVDTSAIVLPGDPEITSTSPIDGAADVYTNASVVINFNESMLASSVSVNMIETISLAPATGLVLTWSATNTVVTVTHDDFTPSVEYTVTVAGTDLGGASLTAGPVPNPFTFTTGTGSGAAYSIINLGIARDADAPGSSVIVSWQTDPSTHENVKIYYKDGNYSLAAVDWTEIIGPAIIVNADLDTFTDPDAASQVSSGTSRYYKIIPAPIGTETLTDSDLTSEVVGKFDMTALATLEYNMVSIPLVPSATDLDTIIGDQLTGVALEFQSDKVYYPDGLGGFEIAWLKDDGQWYEAGSDVTSSPISVDITKGMYVYINSGADHTDKTISLVGLINTSDAIQTVEQDYNMVGTPYPVTVALTDSGLFASGLLASALEFSASRIYSPNGAGGFDVAWLHDSGNWYDAGTMDPASIVLTPGVGYYVYNIDDVTPSFTWTYPKPY